MTCPNHTRGWKDSVYKLSLGKLGPPLLFFGKLMGPGTAQRWHRNSRSDMPSLLLRPLRLFSFCKTNTTRGFVLQRKLQLSNVGCANHPRRRKAPWLGQQKTRQGFRRPLFRHLHSTACHVAKKVVLNRPAAKKLRKGCKGQVALLSAPRLQLQSRPQFTQFSFVHRKRAWGPRTVLLR